MSLPKLHNLLWHRRIGNVVEYVVTVVAICPLFSERHSPAQVPRDAAVKAAMQMQSVCSRDLVVRESPQRDRLGF